MSKKYVPSFLKDPSSIPNTTSAWSGNRSAGAPTLSTFNKFSALDDDAPKQKSIINTSLPAKEAPKLIPATLASLTSNGSVNTREGQNRSFASKFKDQVTKLESSGSGNRSTTVVTSINFASEDDFPTLGGPKKNIVVIPPITKNVVSNISFADRAKEWAKKEEDEKALALVADKNEDVSEITGKAISIFALRRRQENVEEEEEEEEDINHNYEESSLGESDSYEMPEDQELSEDENNEEGADEFNQDVGWDGRKREDLY
jgi:hypothetical protein